MALESLKGAPADGTVLTGELVNREVIPTPGETGRAERFRIQLKLGNRDLFGADFRWELVIVPGVAHSGRRMSAAAADHPYGAVQ